MKELVKFLIIIIIFSTVSYSQNKYEKIVISKDIELLKISDRSYIHVSYANLPDYGRISANGFLYTINGKGYLFDTPWDDSLTKVMIDYIQDTMKIKIIGFVPNHWHEDCMGGLNYIHKIGIESYSSEKTRETAKLKYLPIPKHGFLKALTLKLDTKKIICKYYGAGHSLDNIIVWFPSEKILFAGCMVKELKSKSLGNLSDADLKEWPKTIKKVMNEYQSAEIIIPGHGTSGGKELLVHTLELLTINNK
jgi:metallo-beta-lactamase class B